MIAGIGIPILALCVVAWWWMAAFERQLAIWWLRVDIGPMYRPRPQGLSPWGWLKYHLGSSVTWTSLLYLLAKFPLSLLSFMLGLALVALSSFLIFAPVPVLIDISLGYAYDSADLIGSCFLTALGLGVGLVSLHLLNGLAMVSGRFARLMLGQSDLAEQLREQRQVAVAATKLAERSDQKRRELIVNVSHELRTPIASIRGHVESLQIALERNETGAQAAPPAELRNYLGIIGREAERLGTLVDELLSLARAESGELKVEVAPVDAAGVVEEVWASLAPLAKRDRQIILVRDVAAGVQPVLADRQRLTQVLLNLARNAVAYTPAGGIVSISLRQDDPETVTLSVADTGMGIAAGGSGPHLRALLPHRRVARPHLRRLRPGAGHRARLRRRDGRHDQCGERRRRREHLHGDAAYRHGGAGAPAAAAARTGRWPTASSRLLRTPGVACSRGDGTVDNA